MLRLNRSEKILKLIVGIFIALIITQPGSKLVSTKEISKENVKLSLHLAWSFNSIKKFK